MQNAYNELGKLLTKHRKKNKKEKKKMSIKAHYK
jgi:hypothetical protein